MEWIDGSFVFVSFSDVLRIGIFLGISYLVYLIIYAVIFKKFGTPKKNVPNSKQEHHTG